MSEKGIEKGIEEGRQLLLRAPRIVFNIMRWISWYYEPSYNEGDKALVICEQCGEQDINVLSWADHLHTRQGYLRFHTRIWGEQEVECGHEVWP